MISKNNPKLMWLPISGKRFKVIHLNHSRTSSKSSKIQCIISGISLMVVKMPLENKNILLVKWNILIVGTNILLVKSYIRIVGVNILKVGVNILVVGTNILLVWKNMLVVGVNILLVWTNILLADDNIFLVDESKIPNFSQIAA